VTARLVAAIIARDEEAQLPGCLASIAWADERVVVLDDRTIDQSADVARQRGALVVVRGFTTFPAQRNAVLDLVAATGRADWVLFVDADERTPTALANEIRMVVERSGEDAPVGYWIPRRNYIWGGWVRHGGWSPDYQMRLLKLNSARYDESVDVHEVVKLTGAAGSLSEPFLHYNYDRLDQFLRKQRQYAGLEARRLARQGIRPRPHNFVLQPYREFRRRYVELDGKQDGWRGLALCLLLAWFTAVTYADLTRVPID
jgi:glycosyltransferase involved in cell wall biosynthesis